MNSVQNIKINYQALENNQNQTAIERSSILEGKGMQVGDMVINTTFPRQTLKQKHEGLLLYVSEESGCFGMAEK